MGSEMCIRDRLWVLLEDVGAEALKERIEMPLSSLKAAPFYGCYIVRPTNVLGFDENPERQQSLEQLIEIVGAEVVDFPGKTKCCGFPILTINENASLKMVANHTGDAQELGADIMVTPCPLCHLNLDGFQPRAARKNKRQIELPILHLPQLIGLALGLDPKELGLQRHIMSPKKVLSGLGVRM